MLHWLSKQTGMPLTASQLNHAIRRNFGGLQTGYDLGGDTYLDPIEEFEKLLQLTDHVTDPDLGNFPEDVCDVCCYGCFTKCSFFCYP